MAACSFARLLQTAPIGKSVNVRLIHRTAPMCSVKAGKQKPTRNRSKPLTYEQSYDPTGIAHLKSWNSWNTTTLEGGQRIAETLIDDMFIRKFIYGTFIGMVLSEVIIKRQHNIIRIAFILQIKVSLTKIAFLIGYSEELLGHWLQCPVKLEIQFTDDNKAVIFKYI